MRHSHRVTLLVLTLVGATIAGCDAASIEGTGTEDVVTARCPSSISFELDKPFVFRETPETQYDGTPLSATEQGRVKAVMDSARTQGPTKTTFANLEKNRTTCTYSDGPENRAVLRTTDGKDRLDITKGDFRVFAFPESFDKSGIVFGPRAVVNYFANIRASGAREGGASINVRIGKIRISTARSRPSQGPTVLRVPVLDDSGALVHDTEPSFPKTVDLDGQDGPDAYTTLTNRIEEAGIEPMRYAGPNDYETDDPATSICFRGDETEVCGLLTAFTDNLLSDMFGIAGDEDEDTGCVVTKDNVSIEYYMSESDSTSSADIPRCK